jgi:hypothetical protein
VAKRSLNCNTINRGVVIGSLLDLRAAFLREPRLPYGTGTTVYLTTNLTAALSSTPIALTLFSGLPTRGLVMRLAITTIAVIVSALFCGQQTWALLFSSSTDATYTGPCDLVTCAEAYSVTRAMKRNYTGPLFQLVNVNTGVTLDIEQTTQKKADTSTWSRFCSGQTAVCRISKFYSQINIGANNLTPDVGVNAFCMSAPTINCASLFAIEAATGLFVADVVEPAKFSLGSSDNAAVGINGGTGPSTVMMNGQVPRSTNGICGGSFGVSHICATTSCVDTGNTMNEVGFFYGTSGSIACGSPSNWCPEADYEGQGDSGPDVTTQRNVIFMNSVLPNRSNFTYLTQGVLNGITQWNHRRQTGGSPGMVLGARLRLGAGGDFCQPSPIIFREGLITNTQITAGDEAAVRANMVAFYSGLSFSSAR